MNKGQSGLFTGKKRDVQAPEKKFRSGKFIAHETNRMQLDEIK